MANKCCKKWKEANRVGWLDEDEYWVWYKRKEINFCPQCGSSLKEPESREIYKEENQGQKYHYWCCRCVEMEKSRCDGCLFPASSKQPTHFEPKQESKWCECPRPYVKGKDATTCSVCSKPFQPGTVAEIKPTPKLPEKFNPKEYKPQWHLEETINQLIDYLEAKK